MMKPRWGWRVGRHPLTTIATTQSRHAQPLVISNRREKSLREAPVHQRGLRIRTRAASPRVSNSAGHPTQAHVSGDGHGKAASSRARAPHSSTGASRGDVSGARHDGLGWEWRDWGWGRRGLHDGECAGWTSSSPGEAPGSSPGPFTPGHRVQPAPRLAASPPRRLAALPPVRHTATRPRIPA